MKHQAPLRLVAPAIQPITLAEAKAQCRVAHSDEDTLITALIAAAVDHLDGHAGILGRCLITQTWRQDFEDWSLDDYLRLPFPNATAVTSLKYFDPAGAEQTLPSGHYWLRHDRSSAVVWFRDAFASPNLTDDRPDAVQVTFEAGYGATAADVPSAIRHAILLLVAHLYENREASIVGQATVSELPFAVDALLSPYRRVGT